MNVTLKFGLGAALLAVVAVGAWVRQVLDERLRDFQTQAGAFSLAPVASRSNAPSPAPPPANPYSGEPDPSVVAARAVPLTPAALDAWSALLRPADLPFADETPLQDVLKYLRASTRSDRLPDGLRIYVDPVGLLEAEKTLDSPVQIELSGVPLARGLKLLLEQLDLDYQVDADGLVTIDYLDQFEASPSRPLLISAEDFAILRDQAIARRASHDQAIGGDDPTTGAFCGMGGGSFGGGGFR